MRCYYTKMSKEIRDHKMKRQRESNFAIFKQSLKKISKEYCMQSSISGVKYLVNKDIPFVERIIWIVTLLGALVCSVSLVQRTFSEYYNSPLTTTQYPEGVSVETFNFPAVTICTNNRISKRAVTRLAENLLEEKRNSKYNMSEMLSLLFGLGQLYDMQPISENAVNADQLHLALGEYEVNELLKNLTPRCEDLLQRCMWNEEPINCSSLFDFRLTAGGYCCTFNYIRQSDTTFDFETKVKSITHANKSAFDYDQGLKALLNLNEFDDFYYMNPSQGALIFFSDPFDFPDGPSGSFGIQIISPIIHMSVHVTPTYTEASAGIRHIPVRIRNCLFNDESPYLPLYTSSDCYLKCRMEFLMKKCNCTPFNMPKIKHSKTCDMKDVSCLRLHYAKSISILPTNQMISDESDLTTPNYGIHCPMCYPTCSKISYSYKFHNVYLLPEFIDTKDDWLIGANLTYTSIVHVKYAQGYANRFAVNVILQWFDLISNIGSTCGFVTGFSFISVLEFFYFFVVKLTRDVKQRINENEIIDNSKSLNNTKHPRRRGDAWINYMKYEPNSQYHSLYWNEIINSIPPARLRRY